MITDSYPSVPPHSRDVASKEEHRQRFNLLAFGTTFEDGLQPSSTAVRSRKVLTKAEYHEIVRRLRFPETMALETTGSGRARRGSAERKWDIQKLRYRLDGASTTAEDDPAEHLQYYSDGVWRIVVHQEMVFDAVYDVHVTLLHKKSGVMRPVISKVYYNVTERHCKILVETCPVCNSNASPAVIHPPSINDSRFRDQVVVCIVDYSTAPVTHYNGLEMKYVVVVQDKATKFTVLRPINRIDLRLLAYELKSIFGIIGYPRRIIQSAGDIKAFDDEFLKDIIHPRQPGCVHQSSLINGLALKVDNVISKLSQQSEQANWLSVIPDASEELNKEAYRQVYNTEWSCALPNKTDNVMESQSDNTHEVMNDLLLTMDPTSDDERGSNDNMGTGLDSSNHEDEWEEDRVEENRDRTLNAKLLCRWCNDYTMCSQQQLSYAHESYYDSMANKKRNMDIDFINLFGVLKYHQGHRTDRIFIATNTLNSTNIQSDPKLPGNVKEITAVAEREGRFVALKIKLHPDNTTIVYDFRQNREKEELDQWVEIEETILERCGINKNGILTGPKWMMRYHQKKDFPCKTTAVQTDDSESGPITCLTLWNLLCPGQVEELFGEKVMGRGGLPLTKLDNDIDKWRKLCIVEMKNLLEQFMKEMIVRKRKKKRDE